MDRARICVGMRNSVFQSLAFSPKASMHRRPIWVNVTVEKKKKNGYRVATVQSVCQVATANRRRG